MLALPVFNYISIYTYQQEKLLTFTLADVVYITHTFNLLKVEVIANI